MSEYQGDIAEDATIEWDFNTRDTDGAPITLGGTPAVSVYKDGGATESTAGVTLTVDLDSRTGMHHIEIDTSADAFYATGSNYSAVITTGTVDGTSVVGAVLGTFSIENRFDEVDVTKIAGDADSATGLGLGFDSAGVALGDGNPSYQAQLDNIANVGAATSLPATSYFLNIGTETANSVDNVDAVDGVKHTHTDTGGAMDLYYDTNITTSGRPVACQATGLLNGGNDDLDGVYVLKYASSSLGSGTISVTNSSTAVTGSGTTFTTDFDDTNVTENTIRIGGVSYTIATVTDNTNIVLERAFQGSTDSGLSYYVDRWRRMGDYEGQNNTSNNTIRPFTIFNNEFSDDGNVRCRFVALSGLTSATLRMDQFFCDFSTIAESAGYDNSSVWCDEDNGTSTGTTPQVDGIVTNRSDDFDNAQTIAEALGYTRITLTNGNSITLAATINTFKIDGEGATINLGSQDIGGSRFQGPTITGTGTGTTPVFDDCFISTCTLPPCVIAASLFTGTMTVGSTGNYVIFDCGSGIAGSNPTIDFNSVGNVNMAFQRWSGGLTLNGLSAGDVVELDMVSGDTLTINGTGGTVKINGIVDEIVDNSSAAVTIVEVGVFNRRSIGVYRDGVHIDTFGTNTGEVVYLDGTTDRPVSTLATATTIAGNVEDGIRKIFIEKGSSITLAQTYQRWFFNGKGGNIALGGQDITLSTFDGHNVSGVGTATSRVFWRACRFNGCTLPESAFVEGSFNGTITLSAAASYSGLNCRATDEDSRPSFDFGGAVGSTTLNLNNWGGALEVQNMGQAGTDKLSIDGNGKIEINANCTGVTIYYRGEFEIVDNSGGAVTLEEDGKVSGALTDIGLDHLVSTSVTGTDVADNSIIAKLVSASLTADFDSYSNLTDSLEAIGTSQATQTLQLATIDTNVDAILVDTGTTIPGLITALNDLSAAEVNAEVDTALADIGLDHLISSAVVGADVADNSIIAQIVSSAATADWDTFDNETDSLQAIRDATGGGGGSATLGNQLDIKAILQALTGKTVKS